MAFGRTGSAVCELFVPSSMAFSAVNGKTNQIKSSKEEKGQLSFRSAILSDSGRRIIHPDDLALTDCTGAFCVATLHARRLFDLIPTELF